MKTIKKKLQDGVSIIELLVVIAVFSVIGIFVTVSMFLTLRGAGKNNSTIKVRENLATSLSVVERQLRNAKGIVGCSNPDNTKRVDYIDIDGYRSSFSCEHDEGDKGTGYIASGSARLNSSDINITNCSFVCTEEIAGKPATVDISVTAEDARISSSIEKGTVSVTTKIYLRNY